MKIGEWDVKEAGARQHRVTFGNNTISNTSEWVKGSLNPTLLGNTVGLKTIRTVLVVKGKDREEILGRKSLIISKCLEPVILTLDNYQHRLYAVLKKTDTDETSMNRWHLLTLEWNCYEFGDRITQTFEGCETMSVYNPGNMITPATIHIWPQIGTATLIVAGISRSLVMEENYEVVVKNTEAGKEIILDGETGLITEAGQIKAGDVEIWELPSLLPGENTITVSTTVNVTITFSPRYM